MDDYSELSYNLTKIISKDDKKNNGIYFTNPKTIIKNLNFLEPYMKEVKTVLEPSCGSCEYLRLLTEKYQHLDITGIEYNKTIFCSIKDLGMDVELFNEDYLLYKSTIKYDLIIGNPPYYVMKKKVIDPFYYEYFDGRPNIFILFIIKSLGLLNEDGILSFVLPRNFLNCIYYDKTRKYISNNFKILNILECGEKYIETKQETIILILKKTEPDTSKRGDFILDIDKYTIFGLTKNINKIKTLRSNSSSLKELGFVVNVGNIVWNNCKTELTDDIEKTRLIYSSDIKSKKLITQKYSNKDKKNYIDRQGRKGPLLIVNRGYGVGKYTFDYCLLDGNFEYLIENHLICIKYNRGDITDDEELKKIYEKIIKSFDLCKTLEFIELYFGNNAINTAELYEILPIYEI